MRRARHKRPPQKGNRHDGNGSPREDYVDEGDCQGCAYPKKSHDHVRVQRTEREQVSGTGAFLLPHQPCSNRHAEIGTNGHTGPKIQFGGVQPA